MSIALMIDQRVSEGIKCNFFGEEAFTTTIPAQFVKKYNADIVPIHIERTYGNNFKLKIFEPMQFSKNDEVEKITLKLNIFLEQLVVKRISGFGHIIGGRNNLILTFLLIDASTYEKYGS